MDEPLSLFWIYGNEEYVLRYPRNSYRWSGFTKDSDICCSFVVLEEKCLVFDLGRGCQHPPRNGKDAPPQAESSSYGPVFKTALLINDLLGLLPGFKLAKGKTREEARRWKVGQVAKGTSFPMGDQGTLEVLKALPDSKLLVKFMPKNPIKAAIKDLIALVAQKDSELHHTEVVSNIVEGDNPPIVIFIIS